MSVNGHDAFWDPMLGVDGAVIPVGGVLRRRPRRRGAEAPRGDAGGRRAHVAEGEARGAQGGGGAGGPDRRRARRSGRPRRNRATPPTSTRRRPRRRRRRRERRRVQPAALRRGARGGAGAQGGEGGGAGGGARRRRDAARAAAEQGRELARRGEARRRSCPRAETTCQLQQAQALIEQMTTTPNPTMSPPRLAAADEPVRTTVAAAAGRPARARRLGACGHPVRARQDDEENRRHLARR